jgi:LCP family protein required for cell wall assembly
MNQGEPKIIDALSYFKESRLKKTGLIISIAAVVVLALWLGSSFYFRLPSGDVAEQDPENNGLAAFDKFDILLLGIDGRAETEYSNRTDTMILASMDTKAMQARLLTIPRDTRIKYKDRWMKINAAYGIDGAAGSVAAAEELLGTKIDRYAVVDFNGVVELVDLMGGIEVDVPKRMYKPLENIDLEKGPQHLDGAQALGYMRYRDGTLSDFDRSERQKEVILQLAKKLLSPGYILKLPETVETALKYMDTDLSSKEMIGFLKAGNDFLEQGIESLLLPGKAATINGGWYYIPDVDALKEKMKTLDEEKPQDRPRPEEEPEAEPKAEPTPAEVQEPAEPAQVPAKEPGQEPVEEPAEPEDPAAIEEPAEGQGPEEAEKPTLGEESAAGEKPQEGQPAEGRSPEDALSPEEAQ